MMKRTLGLSRALSEQADERTRIASRRQVIRLGPHNFPAGPVSSVDIFVGRFVIGDPRLLGIPFEPTGRVLHRDVAQQDGFGHGSSKVDRRKQMRPVTAENRVNEGMVVPERLQLGRLYAGELFLGKKDG